MKHSDTVPLQFYKHPPLSFTEVPPLALYIHVPWCVKKCPYCDFNSHQVQKNYNSEHASNSNTTSTVSEELEESYLSALILDLEQTLPLIWGRKLISIFIGGGTPSILSARFYEKLFSQIQALIPFSQIEVTLEANPGTFEAQKFKDYRSLGINRLSIGVQSFKEENLKNLGRIHSGEMAQRAIEMAHHAGFTNFNIDLMFGLENQTIEDALKDLETALTFKPTHLSWYQLNIEPNTVFYKSPPPLPEHDLIYTMQEEGQKFLSHHGFHSYETSAYTKDAFCQHNLNYWTFGDYMGIGAGAHGKITDVSKGTITRIMKHKSPKIYLEGLLSKQFTKETRTLSAEELPFEFMLNALRLTQGVDISLFEQRTGLSRNHLAVKLKMAIDKGLLLPSRLQATPQGALFLNDLIEIFL